MNVHGKETIPESWEELEESAHSSSTIIAGSPSQSPGRAAKAAAQPIWSDLSAPGEGVVFVTGQTPYVPQITRILPRPPKPRGDGQSASLARDTDSGATVLTLEEKQRRYAEARRRIFTEEADKS